MCWSGSRIPSMEGVTACGTFPQDFACRGHVLGAVQEMGTGISLPPATPAYSQSLSGQVLPRPLLKVSLADTGIRTLSFWTKRDGPKPFPSKTAVTSNGIAVTSMSPFTCFTWLCAANSFSKAVGATPVQQRPPLAGTGQLCPALGLLRLGWMRLCVQKVRSLSHFCHLPEGEIIPAYN